jgi:hypothetical protein
MIFIQLQRDSRIFIWFFSKADYAAIYLMNIFEYPRFIYDNKPNSIYAMFS